MLEATSTIRDALIAHTEPVYGFTTLHASLRAFMAADVWQDTTMATKSASYAFGIIGLGKFILRLPAEILEEELPRLKLTLITVRGDWTGSLCLADGCTLLIQALNDATSLVVRESAATAIIASQLVLGDETHLFTLLDGLADQKKNLLTYLFDKHGARSQNITKKPLAGKTLEKEMLRLDGRTNTPPRINVVQ